MFAVAILAGRRSGGRRPARIIRTGFALSTLGMALIIPIVPEADSGWYLFVPLVIAGAGLGLLVSQLNNYTLAPIDDERISEAAGVNSASGSFGLSFGLAVAGGILLATLSLAFTNMTNASPVIPSTQQQQIAQTLEDDAQVVSNTQLDELLADEPPDVQQAVLEHQHRRDEPRPPGRAARADPRRPARALQRVPHDAPPGHRTFPFRGSGGVGLIDGAQLSDRKGRGAACQVRSGVVTTPGDPPEGSKSSNGSPVVDRRTYFASLLATGTGRNSTKGMMLPGCVRVHPMCVMRRPLRRVSVGASPDQGAEPWPSGRFN